MKLYSDLPGRRTTQLLTDVLVFCWVGLWVVLGRVMHDTVLSLRTPADSMVGAGGSLRDSMTAAGDQLGRLPAIGDDLAKPFAAAARSGQQLTRIGTDLGDTVDRLSMLAGLVTATVPILLVVGIWLFVRIRFVRRATAAQRFVDANEDLDLFALRAMVRQPMHLLARISADPAGAWRAREPVTVRRLAELELRTNGLRPPRTARD